MTCALLLALLPCACSEAPSDHVAGVDLLAEGSGLRVVASPQEADAESTVASWDFEGPGPLPWKTRSQGGAVHALRSARKPHGGRSSLCLLASAGSSEVEAYVVVPVKPRTPYRLEGHLRTHGSEHRPDLRLAEFREPVADPEWGDAFARHEESVAADRDDAWVRVDHPLRTGAAARSLWIGVRLTGSGRVCVDDVRLSERAGTAASPTEPAIGYARVGDELRWSLLAWSPSEHRIRVEVPTGARLRFATGVEGSGTPGVSGQLHFAVEATGAGHTDTLYQRDASAADPWLVADVSLERYAGREVELVLRTEPRGLWQLGAWAHPRIFRPQPAAARERPPDVFLLSIDTLRADHLGCYGYPRPTSPAIDRFAADAVLFENAYTPLPRTTPSLASLMTGAYPRAHGLMTLLDSLADEQQTLAEELRKEGYATAAFVSPNVPFRSGLWQGFDVFFQADQRNSRAEELARRAAAWVDAHRGEKRFLWLHVWDPHFRYDPPEPQRSLFDPAPGTPFRLYERLDRGELKLGQVFFENDLTAEEQRRAISLYDGEIRYSDDTLGAFLDHLRELGAYDPALIVVTADHGESLGEHGYHYEHGEYLYDGTLRIPLVVRFPGGRERGRRIAAHAMISDVSATVLAVATPGRPLSSRGRDLARLSRTGDPGEPVFHETGHRFFAENPRRYLDGIAGNWKSVRLGRWKLIRIPKPEGDLYELYDVEADPDETHDVYREGDPMARRLIGMLDDWLAGFERDAERKSPELDPAAAARLRALGYLD